ncbi:MAG: cobalamin biosynthesis protein [Planctomycetota bacterium]
MLIKNDKKYAILTLSEKGLRLAEKISTEYQNMDILIHSSVTYPENTEIKVFDKVIEKTKEIFTAYDGLIYIMPTGVVTRAVGPLVESKVKDPAVIVMDVEARWAISLLCGHEGGANRLAEEIANITGAEPIVTTTSEADRTLIVGVGCRKGIIAEEIVSAIEETLNSKGLLRNDIRLLASADVKENEEGIYKAAEILGAGLRFIPAGRILNSNREFQASDFVMTKVNLPAVAEPSALLGGKDTKLVINKTKFENVTVAVARENAY